MPNYNLTPPDLKPQDIERFHRSYSKAGNCWLWQRVRSEGGYGFFKMFKGKTPIRVDMAHRVQFFLKTNEWPEVVRHTCDNPPCVNPDHLFLGTAKDNRRDCVNKGRHAKGIKMARARPSVWSPKRVKAIRAAFATGAISQNQLSIIAGEDVRTICDIINRRTWDFPEYD